jgi:hypothetical protein
MTFKFFTDESEASRSQRAPDGDAASLQPEPLPKNPRNEVQCETSSTEFDALSLFLPEDPGAGAGSTPALISESHQTSSHAPALAIRGISAASRVDSTALDDLRTLLRQTEIALDRSKSDANALRLDLSQLRDIGTQLAQEYTSLGNASRQTEERSEMAAEALNAIENRLGLLEVVRDLTNSTDDRLASLSQLAEEVMYRAADFQAQKESIDHGLVEATRVTELLAALEARVTKLTEKNELLRHAEETVGHFERRAAETTAYLERRVNDVEAQKHTIEHALIEATRVTDILSALDGRVATLTRHDQLLGHAEERVGHLERRAAEAAVRLEQAARTTGELDHELANIQKQLQTLTESARNNVEMLTNHQQRGEIHHLMPVSRSGTVSELTASAGATSRRAQKTRQPVQLWAAVLGALAVLALLGITLMRSRDQPVQIASTTRAAQRESPLYASASALASRTLGFATSAISANRPAGTITMMPTTEAASDARPTKNPVRPPAVIGVAAGRSGPVPSTRTPRTIEPSQHTGSAEATVQQFIGVLAVTSVPTGAAVFINQQHVGETPLQLTRLRAGSHVIRIEHEGYERWTTAVLVPADKRTRVSAKLQPIRGH